MRRGGYGWFTLYRSKKFAAILQKQVSSFLIRTQCSQTAFKPIRFYSLLTLQQGVKPKALFAPVQFQYGSKVSSHSVVVPSCLIIFTNHSALTNRLHALPDLVFAARQCQTGSSDLGDKPGRRWQFNKDNFPVHPKPLLWLVIQDVASHLQAQDSPAHHGTALQDIGCCSSITMISN